LQPFCNICFVWRSFISIFLGSDKMVKIL
jgi:hypothetical protein